METPATSVDPLAVARPHDSSAFATDNTPARTTTVYRIAEVEREADSATGDRFLPTDCNILPPREPDQFLAADAAHVSPHPGDATRFVMADPTDLPPGESEALSVGAADDGARPPATSDETADGSFRGRFGAIFASAAVFANTDLDANFATWYQTHIRSSETNRAADFFRPLGNGYYTIPVYVSAKFMGEYFDDVPGMGLLGQFGDRASRALLVGAPPLLAVQYLTGGGRPSDYADQSYWRPFHSSHGASGHAFMGAVPFLTLAGMTDDPWAKCFFYACSPWTGMTRINDNVHYLSQVWLGWWMAYLACESVNKTEGQKGPMVVTPLITPEMTGVGVVYEH
jgi:hypothetical protein